MVQIIENTGSRGSRIGGKIGQALSDQLPKEAERYRLSQGLKEVGQQQNQSPFQQFAALAGVPGITPQMLESGAELLKQQRFRQAYGQGQAQGGQQQQSQTQGQAPQGQDFRNVQFNQLPGQVQRGEAQPQGLGSREEQVLDNPPSAAEHPGSEEYLPAKPWNQQMTDDAITEAFDTGKATTLQEAMGYASNKRQLYEAAPEAERARYNYKKGIDTETESLFRSQLQQRLQKEGAETFKDIPGELQLGLIKEAQSDVASGKYTPKQAAEHYSNAALELTKSLGNAKEIANADWPDLVNPLKKEERLKRLSTISDKFSKSNASEYLYNFLKTKGQDAAGNNLGMGLSPGMAAVISYPISKNLEKVINDADFPLIGYGKRQQEAGRVAKEVLNNLTPKDSLLAVARQLKDKHPNFDETAFFDYIRDNPEMWSHNDRIGREVETGVSDVFPNWGDIFLIPSQKHITPAHRSRK